MFHSLYKFSRRRSHVPLAKWGDVHRLRSIIRVLPNTMLSPDISWDFVGFQVSPLKARSYTKTTKCNSIGSVRRTFSRQYPCTQGALPNINIF